MKEIWKDVEGYEGIYQISNFGRVKSLKFVKEKILKTRKAINGYIIVDLYKDGKMKTYYVHRLVAEAFIPNPLNLPEINHIDENKTNNFSSNIEWTDHKSNCNYGTRNERLLKNRNGKTALKKVLCVETNIVYPASMEAQRQTRINQSDIIKCCKGKRKTAGNYHWKYVD